ncbi:MAG TPA: hypothetical protein VLQ29_10715, partial [Candidatus Dormibacteraeota bacterium]|nr:hypothetical protein [Candidatus Dormibacteraeota bacterium]
MTARSNESPKATLSGEESFEEIIHITERNLAKKLGNSECLERWRTKKSFNSARQEWLDAWKRFAEEHGLDSLFGMHAGVQQTL